MSEWMLMTGLPALLLAGVVGFVSGMFGVGGGFLLVPLLSAVLGVPMPIAIGSTACYTLGPATVAMLTRKPKVGFLELPLILAGGLLGGVLIGSRLVASLNDWPPIEFGGKSLPAVDLSVLLCYLVLMVTIASVTFRDALLRKSAPAGVKRRGLFAALPVPPVANIPDLSPSHYSIPLLALTGLGVGFLSGFLGMGGGLVLVPAAIFFLGLRAHDATTVTVVIVFVVSIQSSAVHALHNHVNLSLVAAMLLGGTVGAALGSQISLGMGGRQLRLAFAMLVLVSALIVAWRLWSLWSGSGRP